MEISALTPSELNPPLTNLVTRAFQACANDKVAAAAGSLAFRESPVCHSLSLFVGSQFPIVLNEPDLGGFGHLRDLILSDGKWIASNILHSLARKHPCSRQLL